MRLELAGGIRESAIAAMIAENRVCAGTVTINQLRGIAFLDPIKSPWTMPRHACSYCRALLEAGKARCGNCGAPVMATVT